MSTRRETFTNIYTNNTWNGIGTASGTASELNNTPKLRKYLVDFLKKYEIKSIIDAGCGDFAWMKEVDLSGIRYLGVDIVPGIVENNKSYATELISFVEHDLVTFEFPQADLIIMRDVLIHLPLSDCAEILDRVYRSGSSYLLSSSVPTLSSNYAVENQDISTGEFFMRNLTKLPLGLPEPIEVYWEETHSDIRALSLWKLK